MDRFSKIIPLCFAIPRTIRRIYNWARSLRAVTAVRSGDLRASSEGFMRNSQRRIYPRSSDALACLAVIGMIFNARSSCWRACAGWLLSDKPVPR